jgi:Glycosyl transferase family 2
VSATAVRQHHQLPTRTPETMKLFTSIFDDTRLLPYFLHHYARAGIDEFHMLAPSDSVGELSSLAPEYHITVSTIDWTAMSESFSRGDLATAVLGEVRAHHQADDEWVVILDLDEFVDFGGPIDTVIVRAEAEGANVVKGVMYDRFSADGRTIDPIDGASLDETYPVRSRFIPNVMLGCDDKAVIVKGRLEGAQGAEHHQLVGERAASTVLTIEHFKWTQGSVDRLRARCRKLQELGTSWWIEYARAIEHYETYGRFAWEEFGGELLGWSDIAR